MRPAKLVCVVPTPGARCSASRRPGAERAGRFPARIDGGNFVLEGGVGIESNHGLVYPRIKSGLRLATALNSVA
jgi:hypothetical protein